MSSLLPVAPVAAAGPVAAVPPAPFNTYWVENFAATHLWSAKSDPAVDYGPIPQWTYLLVAAPQTGPRLVVYVQSTKNYAYVDAQSVGPSGPPPPDWLATITAPAPKPTPTMSSVNWVGRVGASGLIERQSPSVQASVLATLPAGTVVQVTRWVLGDEIRFGDWTWAKLADGGYGYSEALQAIPLTIAPPIPVSHPSGQWIDVNLMQETAVAYQDATPLYLARVSTGSPDWETPVGLHYIQRRVADETMSSSTLNHLSLDAFQSTHANYNLAHVLYTQYIDGSGDALHDNYWLPAAEFGIPHSHGCVGMRLADAHWFWNWASEGVPVLVRAS